MYAAPNRNAPFSEELTLSSADDSTQDLAGSPSVEPGATTRAELSRRASGGVFIVATRGLLILFVGFGGTVLLARLLTPHDFGVVAIGTAVVMVIALFSDGGLGAALIRRPEPPTTLELEALTGLQFTVTTFLALVIALAAIPLGQIGGVVALMATSMPLVALQFPGRILLERSLSYRPLALVEVGQVLTYYAWAIGFVLAGFGVWGLASATVAMRAVAAIMMALVSPVGIVRPRFSWRATRPLLGFGVRFQAVSATWLVRDQGLNAAIAAIASAATLGLWSLARRLMELPYLLFESLLRVSFPAISQLVTAKEDISGLLERVLTMAVVASGIVLTGLAASAPGLVPGLFGEDWQAASGAIPWACLGVAIGGSVSVATHSYLYAVGDASTPLRAVIRGTTVLFAITLPLLPFIGVTAVGVGWLAAAIIESCTLGRGVKKSIQVSFALPLLGPIAIGIVAASIGWLVAESGGASLVSGIVGGLLASLLFQAGLFVFRRELLFETYRFGLRSMRSATRNA